MTFIPQINPNGKLLVEYRRKLQPKQPVPTKKSGVWQIESFADPYTHYDNKWCRILFQPDPPPADFEYE